MVFARKIIKITEFLWYLSPKNNKFPEFYMIFARKVPEFYIMIARKYFSPVFYSRPSGVCRYGRLLYSAHVFLLFFIKRISVKTATLFGAIYRRTYGLTGKDVSVSFRQIRPGVFPGGPKNWAKSTRFRTWKFSTEKRFIMGRFTSIVPLIIIVAPRKLYSE